MNTHVKKISGCKVCRDAGKDENVYTGHMTRDRTGTVVCPTLLEQECRYCREKGHTPKFCPVLKENEKRRAKFVRAEFHRENVIRASMPKMLPNKRVASFAALMDDSDDEDDDDVVQLSANVTLRPGQESYAEMLKKESSSQKDEKNLCAVAIPKVNRPTESRR